MSRPSISVVTPTLGRPEEVDGLLESLNAQELRPAELILVDGAPEEERRTEELVRAKSAGLGYRCRYIRHGGGTAIQRNVGIDATQGSFLAFVDDDIRLEADFFTRMVEAFRLGGDRVGGVAGYITNVHLDPATSPRWRWYRALRLFRTYEPGRYDFDTGYPINRYLQPPHDDLREIDFMGAGCAVWRREVFADGLRFSEFFRGYGVLEDAHLALRAARGWRLLENGEARCVHLRSPSSRVDGRQVAWMSAVNYRFVFVDVCPRRRVSQELRFWRVQLFDLLRFFAHALRNGRRQGWGQVAGKIAGIRAASRIWSSEDAVPGGASISETAGIGWLTPWRSLPFDPSTREALEKEVAGQRPEAAITVGRIDNDGRLLGLYGKIPGLPSISATEFVPRRRFPVDVVIQDGAILVCKDFRGRREALMREWQALRRLAGKTSVPAVHHVDLEGHRIYKTYIYGRTLRDVLVEAGARILSVQTDGEPDLEDLAHQERLEAVLARGTKLLESCFPADFVQRIEAELERIHSSRVAQLSLTFGNVMIQHETGAPALIDFDNARCYRTRFHPGFLLRRRRDRSTFAKIYRPGGRAS